MYLDTTPKTQKPYEPKNEQERHLAYLMKSWPKKFTFYDLCLYIENRIKDSKK